VAHNNENTALSEQDTRMVIDLILALPHGVMGMSADFEGLVETLYVSPNYPKSLSNV
jgi:hypothetical protein